MFKKGDLVQMNIEFCSTTQPPMGTYGIIIHAEDWGEPESSQPGAAEQFIRVHWAHHKNTGDQCYMNTSLKKAKVK